MDMVTNFKGEKTKPIAGLGPETLSTKLEILNEGI